MNLQHIGHCKLPQMFSYNDLKKQFIIFFNLGNCFGMHIGFLLENLCKYWSYEQIERFLKLIWIIKKIVIITFSYKSRHTRHSNPLLGPGDPIYSPIPEMFNPFLCNFLFLWYSLPTTLCYIYFVIPNLLWYIALWSNLIIAVDANVFAIIMRIFIIFLD